MIFCNDNQDKDYETDNVNDIESDNDKGKIMFVIMIKIKIMTMTKMMMMMMMMMKIMITKTNVNLLKRTVEGFTLFFKHTFFIGRFPKLGFCCSRLLAEALHSGQSLEIRSLMNWYLLSFNLCINSVRSSRT